MKESEIRYIFKPKLNRPTFILGLSEPVGINDVVVQSLIEHTRSEKFAELYSPYLPDYLIAEETGLSHLPRYDFYASEIFNPNIVIMTGESSPNPEYSQAYYEIFTSTFNLAEELGCRRFLSFGAFQREKADDKIYVAATTDGLVSSITQKLGGKAFAKGSIDGQIGMIVGMAKVKKLPAICVLGLYETNTDGEETAQNIFQYVIEVLRLQNRG
ncbi:MAG: PAC2 family protein [Candidatus Bathyarchaeota archaeon]